MLLDHILGALGVHGSPSTEETLVEYTGGLNGVFESYCHIKILWKNFLNASWARLIRISLKFNGFSYEVLNLKTFEEIQRLW